MNEEIKKGLLGIVVDETTISQVVPELSALTYRGYKVQDLCDKCDFEEVAYLVLHGELPSKKQFKKCKSCHTVSKSGKHKIGPALWDIVGRKMASFKTYKYSKALKTKDRTWGYEELNAFLANPKNFIKGTKMVFSGIKNTKDRANLILYLRSLSATPKPLPSNP